MQEESIRKIPQQVVRIELDNPLTQKELKAAIDKLKSHKAPESMVYQQRCTN